MTSSLENRVADLGPWFHNLRLRDQRKKYRPLHTTRSATFPPTSGSSSSKQCLTTCTAKSVLDIGCNAGFYSFEMKRRGASRVLGVDHDQVYLNQARFAREQLGLDVDFKQGDVYDIDKLVGNESFDFVVFMGVLYHLRHPLYALEKVAKLVRGKLLFQTMERGSWELEDSPTTSLSPNVTSSSTSVFRACTSSSTRMPATRRTGGFLIQLYASNAAKLRFQHRRTPVP